MTAIRVNIMNSYDRIGVRGKEHEIEKKGLNFIR